MSSGSLRYWREKFMKRLEDLEYIPPEYIPTFLCRGHSVSLKGEAQALLELAIENQWTPPSLDDRRHWATQLVTWGQDNGLISVPPDDLVLILSGLYYGGYA